MRPVGAWCVRGTTVNLDRGGSIRPHGYRKNLSLHSGGGVSAGGAQSFCSTVLWWENGWRLRESRQRLEGEQG